jgi:hypothetical protein
MLSASALHIHVAENRCIVNVIQDPREPQHYKNPESLITVLEDSSGVYWWHRTGRAHKSSMKLSCHRRQD